MLNALRRERLSSSNCAVAASGPRCWPGPALFCALKRIEHFKRATCALAASSSFTLSARQPATNHRRPNRAARAFVLSKGLMVVIARLPVPQ